MSAGVPRPSASRSGAAPDSSSARRLDAGPADTDLAMLVDSMGLAAASFAARNDVDSRGPLMPAITDAAPAQVEGEGDVPPGLRSGEATSGDRPAMRAIRRERPSVRRKQN